MKLFLCLLTCFLFLIAFTTTTAAHEMPAQKGIVSTVTTTAAPDILVATANTFTEEMMTAPLMAEPTFGESDGTISITYYLTTDETIIDALAGNPMATVTGYESDGTTSAIGYMSADTAAGNMGSMDAEAAFQVTKAPPETADMFHSATTENMAIGISKEGHVTATILRC